MRSEPRMTGIAPSGLTVPPEEAVTRTIQVYGGEPGIVLPETRVEHIAMIIIGIMILEETTLSRA